MKLKNTLIIIAAGLLLTTACSNLQRDNRRAAEYADRIESTEAITADEYSEMVSFYCAALDRTLGELQPYHDAHAKAIDSGDTALVAKTKRELTDKTDRIASDSKHIQRLGTNLFLHMSEIPDTTRHRLLSYMADLRTRYQNL